MAGDSEVAFKAALDSLELGALHETFKKEGWKTFMDFAFSTSDPKGSDPALFEKEVVHVLLGAEPGEKKALIPRIRRLYAQAYTYATKHMTDEADPKTEEKVTMHPTDRSSRTEGIRKKITGFEVKAMNMPSNALCDRFATILAKDVVRYVPWDKCTSRDQETMEEPDVKGLRLTKEGFFMQDVQPDSNTDLAGEFLWDYALRRRSVAADIGGLMKFEACDKWTEILKQYLLKSPPPGYRKVSWAQIQAADQALWTYVQRQCETTTKAKPGKDVTEFEVHWQTGMFDYDVRQHLAFLQGSASASSFVPSTGPTNQGMANDERIRRLTNQLKNATEQLAGTKRRLENAGGGQPGKKGKNKGKGKGKNAPQKDFPGCKAQLNGKSVCYSFNMPHGCPLAKTGDTCRKGLHLCILCGGTHSYALPCPSR